MIDGCSERLQLKLDGWRKEYCALRCDESGPLLRDVVKVYWRGLDLISRMNDELEQLMDGIVPATARFSQVGGRKSNPGDPTGDMAVKIDILQREIDSMVEDVNCLEVSVRWGITYMVETRKEREICTMRWVEHLPYTDIGQEAGYSEGYCRSVISKAGKQPTHMG